MTLLDILSQFGTPSNSPAGPIPFGNADTQAPPQANVIAPALLRRLMGYGNDAIGFTDANPPVLQNPIHPAPIIPGGQPGPMPSAPPLGGNGLDPIMYPGAQWGGHRMPNIPKFGLG
jgi:hypothetical protein